jgi:hypothetical protein
MKADEFIDILERSTFGKKIVRFEQHFSAWFKKVEL